ncbi:MAG: VWA domain-containing protein [Ruminococcaceae bacterium]|nr:VWA domain-containing protein [Oscillospiraceae bacterium]
MSNIEFSFENPLYMLLIIPVLAVILMPFFMLPKNRRKSFKKIAPVVIHSVVAFILVLIISGFSIVENSDETAVMVLVDASYSTESVQDKMLEHTEQIIELINDKTPVGIIVFAEDCIYEAKLDDDEKKIDLTEVEVDKEATDINAALEYAAKTAPTDKALRIILLSDGKENEGDSEDCAYFLSTHGIQIDAMYYDTTELATGEVQISSFKGPFGAYVNDEISLVAEIKSNIDEEVVAKLYDGDTLIMTENYSVKKGSNVFETKTVAQKGGIRTYKLVIEPTRDTVLQNNEMYACVNVAGAPSILIITNIKEDTKELVSILSKENNVEVKLGYEAPKNVVEMCDYDEIILSNVEMYELPGGSVTELEKYVSVYGRTLLAIGGSGTFMYGNMSGTLLEDMLPVKLSLDESMEGNSVALMLVLDCSSSMKGEYMNVAKQGAIKCLEAMTDNDYVGVVSFSKEANIDSPLIKADERNKDSLTRIISGLETGRGTYYKDALTLAVGELEKSDADVKHIIFLSDGQPSDSGYEQVVVEGAKQGITVSTIGLSFSSYALDYMAYYGKGRYYYVEGANDLPDIMLTETEKAKVSSLIIGDFATEIYEKSDLTNGIDPSTLPNLKGYLGTTLKEKATAYITTESRHPIYASWDYGFGTVACFTSDLTGNWSSEWLASEIGRSLVSGFVSTTVGNVPNNSSLECKYEIRGKTAEILLTTADLDSKNTVTMVVEVNGNKTEYPLAQMYPGAYSTVIPVSDEGEYVLKFTETNTKNKTVDTLELGMSVTYSGEYDMFIAGGEALLSNLCSYSNGMIHTDVASIANVKMMPIRIVYDPVIPLAVTALVLILADIAIRKLRWNDVKKYFIKDK